MTTKELIEQELKQLPETLLETMLDFLIFLRSSQTQAKVDISWIQFAGILDNTEAKEIQDALE
mgnify:CR=1 FL=1